MHSVTQDIRKSYDLIAGHFSQTRQYVWLDFDLFIPFLGKKLKILDCGCGNGRLLDFLQPYISEYRGLDLSSQMIAEAETRYPQEIFGQADMSDRVAVQNLLQDYLCAGSGLDAIFSIAAFHHLPTDALRLNTLKYWYDMLAPGGIVGMTVWNLWQPKYFKQYCLRFGLWNLLFAKGIGLMIPWRDSAGKVLAQRYYYSFSRQEIRHLAHRAGFVVEYLEYVKQGKVCQGKWGSYNLLVVLRKK